MRQETKRQLLEFLRPLFLGIAFIFKVLYYILLAWWLDPWLRRKANHELIDDVTRNLYFLVSDAQTNGRRSMTVLRSEWPTVEIPWGNLLFTVVRGRGDIYVTVAPSHAPRESYGLGPVVAALEGRHYAERDVVNDLADAGNLLRPRLEALNAAFSEESFPGIRRRL